MIIIGAGPAGVTAAIYAARKSMDFILLTTNIGGQVITSPTIENYTGFQYISGAELTAKFQEHLDIYKFGLKIEEVQKASREDDLFRVKTDLGTYLGKTVIVATGRKSRVLDIPGEIEFKNRGVSYCATCDAPFFQDLDVAVIGGGNSALDAVLQLIKIARSIYIIERGPGLKADMILVEKAKVSDNVRILTNARVVEIIGEGRVTGIKVQVEEKEMLLPVRGVFVEIGSIPNSDMVDFVAKNVWGEIIVNCKCETNIPGLFAAGDNTDAPEKQIIIAAGDGCKAAISAFRYVSKNG